MVATWERRLLIRLQELDPVPEEVVLAAKAAYAARLADRSDQFTSRNEAIEVRGPSGYCATTTTLPSPTPSVTDWAPA